MDVGYVFSCDGPKYRSLASYVNYGKDIIHQSQLYIYENIGIDGPFLTYGTRVLRYTLCEPPFVLVKDEDKRVGGIQSNLTFPPIRKMFY